MFLITGAKVLHFSDTTKFSLHWSSRFQQLTIRNLVKKTNS